MPELPEVQRVVDTLAPYVVSLRIRNARCLRDDFITPRAFDLRSQLHSRLVRSVTRRAKRIVFTLDDGNRFYIHLGMTGHIQIAKPGDEMRAHTHLLIDIDTEPVTQIRLIDPRRFGEVVWLGTDSPDTGLGPEPFDITAAELFDRLGRTRRAVKSALLDQTLVAGIGNIYADESLFRACIHPLTPGTSISIEQSRALVRAMRAVLRRAIKSGGSSLRDYIDADGKRGSFQLEHKVYDRAGQPCFVCKTPIERTVLQGRSTCWCPMCQRV